ncbi:TPA: hypothetical protein RM800_001380 [Yersinia enterocolitica]|nr:hypothetical protein [Yersinia enterocolitica]EKN5913252.1 hypothetical protein [Yersinia enterocolitica]HDL7735611.1 hypothetical protein [Yersinia enterocolitica]HDW8041370.1 hypothetical protein [Yersinia enterocolitica]HEM6610322.1 hypothetical protein [Yersinia enterocolitica]
MDNYFRPAMVWGSVCFLLLYRTFPLDIIIWGKLYQQYDISMLQLIASFSAQALPALMPLMCFLLMISRATHNKVIILTVPFTAWLISKFIITGVFYFISLKTSNIPPYSEGFLRLVERMLTVDWFTDLLVFMLTIMVCSYAFWREYRK